MNSQNGDLKVGASNVKTTAKKQTNMFCKLGNRGNLMQSTATQTEHGVAIAGRKEMKIQCNGMSKSHIQTELHLWDFVIQHTNSTCNNTNDTDYEMLI